MSNDKALAIIPRTVDEVTTLSARFAQSTLVPEALRGKEADVFVTILAGQELGLTPMASLRSIHVIKGKPVLTADVMVALVLGSGKAEYFRCVDASDTSVTYETKRKGSPEPQRVTWTLAEATRAALTGKDNWRWYPRAMLKARCRAELARDVYPDVIAGCYEESEADEIRGIPRPAPPRVVPDAQPDVIDAEVIEPAAFDLDGALVAIRECETEADLRRLGSTFTDAPPSARDAIGAAYQAQKTRLTAVVAA